METGMGASTDGFFGVTASLEDFFFVVVIFCFAFAPFLGFAGVAFFPVPFFLVPFAPLLPCELGLTGAPAFVAASFFFFLIPGGAGRLLLCTEVLGDLFPRLCAEVFTLL